MESTISFLRVLLSYTFASITGGLIAVASASGAAPGADAEILGQWKGVTFVYPHPLDLSLNLEAISPDGSASKLATSPTQDNVKGILSYTILRSVSGPSVSSNDAGSFQVTGRYEPETRRLRLKASLPNPRGSWARDLDLVFAQAPDALGGICVERTDWIKYAVFVRPPDVQNTLWTRLLPEVPGQALTTKDPETGYPDAAWLFPLTQEYPSLDLMHTVMERLFSISINLFEDEHFTKTFRVRFDELSPAHRKALVKSMRVGPYQLWIGQFQDIGTFSYRETVNAVRSQRPIRRWKAWMESRLATLPADESAWLWIYTAETEANEVLSVLWPSEQREIVTIANKARTRLAEPLLRHASEDLLAGAPSLETARALARWAQDQSELLKWVSQDTKTTLSQKINVQLQTICEALIGSTAKDLDNLGSGLDAVLAGNRWYADLNARYSFAYGSNAFSQAIARLQARRPSDLTAALTSMSTQVRNAADLQKVDKVTLDFLSVPGDRQTQPGVQLLQIAAERKAELNRLAYQARFSPLEQQRMGAGTSIQVPAVYDPPTPVEVRLAFLREIEALGGEMVDSQTGRYTIPPLGMFGLFIVIHVNNVEIAPSPTRAPEGGFICKYRLNRSLKLDGAMGQMIMQGTSANDPRPALMQWMLKMGEISNWAEDHFELTPSGWRSPTLRDRGLQSIANFYDELNSNFFPTPTPGY